MSSKSIQIVTITDDDNESKSLLINEDEIRSILCSDELKDKYVAIISICGIFRQGKSFLLNFFLRFLELTCKEKKTNIDQWLNENDKPLQGFSFISGSKRHTRGIHLWKEVFFMTTAEGDEVGILLIDTQGSFDNNSSTDLCAKIFALSTLISSVQIYNLMSRINHHDFTHLKVAPSKIKSNAPFQKLCFLIRDWSNPGQYPYGNGEKYLDELELSSESTQLFDDIKSSFEAITCFLMPHPGKVVATRANYQGSIHDIDEEFVEHVQEFITATVGPTNLMLKTIGGRKVTGAELMRLIEGYAKVFKEESLPEIGSIYKMTAETHHQMAKERAFKLYKKNMDADIKYSAKKVTEQDYNGLHEQHKLTAVEEYMNSKKIKEEEMFKKYKKELLNEIAKRQNWYRALVDEIIKEFAERDRRWQSSRNH